MQTKKDFESSPRQVVEKVIRSQRPATVRQLAHLVLRETSLDEEDFVVVVKEMVADGWPILQEPAYEIESAWDYLLMPSLSMWLWVTSGITILATTAVFVTPDSFPVVVIRWLLGSVLVLFLPGYALLQLLFPKASEMDSLERFALNIGLSLALVPLIGLILNYTPWGIRLLPVTSSISAFTVVFLIAAATRKYLHLREQTAKR